MNYEERIIDTILLTIKDNQEYLTQRENLPQLAKLGYMYNTLWYGGRSASYNGIIPKAEMTEPDGSIYEYDQCDDNPKYKIEMCEPQSETIEDYIYDAWGMHVENGFGPGWEEFEKIVKEGEPLSDLDKMLLKPNKTFDEWVEIMTHQEYPYKRLYPNRASVADHLLCVIGNGYGFKNGYVIEEASGADQDTTDYGDWKNAKFREDIQAVVDKIMADPEAEKVLRYIDEAKAEDREKKLEKERKAWGGMTYEEFRNSDEYKKIFGESEKKEKQREYYPISENYSIITKLNENSHPSYIQAGIEICEDIVANPPQYKKSYNEYQKEQCDGQVKFANKFLDRFKK